MVSHPQPNELASTSLSSSHLLIHNAQLETFDSEKWLIVLSTNMRTEQERPRSLKWSSLSSILFNEIPEVLEEVSLDRYGIVKFLLHATLSCTSLFVIAQNRSIFFAKNNRKRYQASGIA